MQNSRPRSGLTDLLNARQVAGVEDVVVDEHVLAEEVQVGAHVVEEASNLGI